MSKELKEIGGNAIIYQYPNGDYDIVCAAEKVFTPEGWETSMCQEKGQEKGQEKPQGKVREKGKKAEGEDLLRSMRRARAKVRRLALANEFKWFVTLTLDQAKVDRYDPDAIMRKVNKWLGNMVARHGLKYILVPERHKDGAFHFHGFFSDALEAVDSGHLDRGGHTVYNLPQWPLGFTTAIGLYGTYSQAVAYVCKYIGKQEGQRPMGRWYYSGGGLAAPARTVADLDYREVLEDFDGEAVEFSIPGTQMLVVHHREDRNTVVQRSIKTDRMQ